MGCLAKRVLLSTLSLALLLGTVPPVGAAQSVFGMLQASGSAWVASDSAEWTQLSTARPFIAGDRVKTGSDGYLLADLGRQGVVGLYGNAEIASATDSSGPVIDVVKGKVAFHFSPKSSMKLKAEGAGIASHKTAADGYVEFDEHGVPVVVVEQGALQVSLAGNEQQLERGQRLVLKPDAKTQPTQLAGAYGQKEENGKKKKAAGVAASGAAAGAATYGGLTAASWTAIGVVAAAAGGVAAAASSDGNGSPN